MEVLREGYRISFRRAPTLSGEPIPFSAYCPNSIRGKALEQEVESLLQKGAIELAPVPSLGYFSRLFVVMKASGSWRPVIDLSLLNLRVLKTPFKMETIQSTLLSVRRGDWMVSIDLKDAYLQVPIHPESRRYLRFMAFNKVYQFKVLCFGLSTAPQVFTRVMAPVSTILHTLGIHLRWYLDDWMIQASSREQVLLSLRTVLQLCNSLGEVTDGSDTENLLPGSPIGLGQFQGFSSPETCRQAALNWRRVSILHGAACKILAGVARSAFFTNPAHSGGTAADAVVPVSSSSSLGSEGSRCSGSVVSGDRAGSPLVIRLRTPRARRLPSASISPARLVVRRLRCRLGCSPRRPGRFRPLVAGRSSRFHQPAGASGHLLCATAFSTSDPQHLGGGVLRQHDCSGLPEESGRYQVGSIEPDSTRTAPVDGAPLCDSPSSIHYGPQQRLGGLPVSAKSNSGLRMNTEDACVPSTSAAVAGSYRSVCNISESPLHTIFFSLPRSHSNSGMGGRRMPFLLMR